MSKRSRVASAKKVATKHEHHWLPNANDLLINLPRRHSWGIWESHFTKPRRNSCLSFFFFCLVALETLYSLGGGGLVCTLEMEILSLSFTIENANTFRSRMLLKHSGIWINHPLVFAVSCCLVVLFPLFKGWPGVGFKLKQCWQTAFTYSSVLIIVPEISI